MTLDELEKAVQDTIDWIVPSDLRVRLRGDLAIHIAEAVYRAYMVESGEEAAHAEAGRFWNGSSGTYDEDGCW